jgi:succinyl-diaminopimelate desuccinylase
MQSEALDLARALIARPSVTPDDAGCQGLIAARLAPLGFHAETIAGRVIEQVSGVRPELSTGGGTSDGRFIIDICPEIVEFGPVNRSIHKVNEAVALAEIGPLAEVYRLACEDLLGVR